MTADKLMIKAHRCVLASNSEYFKKLFIEKLMEVDQNTVYHIKYVTNTILRNLIDFIYTGTMVILNDANVEVILVFVFRMIYFY